MGAYVANTVAQILTVPPYAVAAVVLCASTYASDRVQRRGIFVAGANALAGIGYMCAITLHLTDSVELTIGSLGCAAYY